MQQVVETLPVEQYTLPSNIYIRPLDDIPQDAIYEDGSPVGAYY